MRPNMTRISTKCISTPRISILKPGALLMVLAAASSAMLFADDWARSAPRNQVTVAPVAPVIVAQGAAADMELRFTVAPGLHINSNKPGSQLLIPTSLTVDAIPQARLTRIQFPGGKPLRLALAPDEILNVYQGEVEVHARVVTQKKAAPGSYTLKGRLRYQACTDNACFPPKVAAVEISVVITAAPAKSAAKK